MDVTGSRSRGWRWGYLGAVLASTVAFRLPAILHPAETNSDAAVVGLQAMHILRGEWSWFLWGSGYQTSVDSAFAALSFGFFGPTARALLFSSLGLHLALTALVWSVLARRLNSACAALALFPLVVSSSPLQTYILYPPREASLTIAIAALWAFDRAADAQRARAFATGAALLALACFADPYALVLVPPIGAFGLACAIDRAELMTSLTSVAGLVVGWVVGAVPLFLFRGSGRATHGQLALDLHDVARNARLLADPCLPWAMGARAWGAAGAASYAPWEGPPVTRALLLVGGTLFVVAILAGGASVFARRIAWPVRRLAIAGGLALPVTVAGFLVSQMVMDLFSARYLAAIPLLAPFALAPLAARFGAGRFALLVVPSATACAIAGWVGYGPFLRAAPRGPTDEALLEAALDSRGVHVAMADYWAAYRLTFLARERLVVVPTNRAEDRYAPYRAAFEAQSSVAYVFDPERSREGAGSMEASLRAGELSSEVRPRRMVAGAAAEPLFEPVFETLHAGRFTALLLKRSPPSAPDEAPR